ncbi:membrane-spanning 4-domains subfamily A member 12-like isoform X4 [Canis lupus dingo]|uniref:membrane-spanning 4-domains subfamily A member 12-like isoform X4 n=1 Tax=Canis lupus dingo TaxID=286419 RepID=UPI0020C468C2|nr:membrane-spanning 4-domains subfamily A member 12-like isoform X4 [Canis lupus dingo]
MPRRHLQIRKETRLLGAIQIMTGLNIHFVGLLWTYLLLSQISAFGKPYLPLSTVTRYPYWSSTCLSYAIIVNILSACIAVIGLILLSLEFIIYSLSTKTPIWPEFVISGIFAIEAEKTSSPKLLKYTIRVNTHSSVLAIIGLFLIGLEIILSLMKQVKIVWIQRSGMMLSVYLWLFSILELFLAITVIGLGNQAFYHTSNLI